MEFTDPVLRLYRTTVRNMLESSKSSHVPNSSYRHASIILEEMARVAKESFHAYCGKFSVDVWTPEVTNQLRVAIENKVDVSIILAGEPESTIPEFLKGHVRRLDLSSVEDRRSDFARVDHFASVDGKSVRIENNRAERRALFAANHTDLADQVERIFNILSEFAKVA